MILNVFRFIWSEAIRNYINTYMQQDFSDIKVLVWDFDGTFYPPNADLWREVREAEYRTIVNHTGWTKNKATEEFSKLHKIKIQSATEVVARLSRIPVKDAALELESYFDRRRFVRRDNNLLKLFGHLRQFRHFILANGTHNRIIQTLEVLGLPETTFEQIVTSETVGVNKPNPKGFKYIIKLTKLPARQHLMIGDRETVDLIPAHELGMLTCLVWGSGTVADVSVPTVYEVYDVLSKRKS